MYESPFYATKGTFSDNNTRSSLPSLAAIGREALRDPISDAQAIVLLGNWLTNESPTKEETTRLAAKLLFPHQERAATLYVQASLGTLDLRESAEMKALSLFDRRDPHSLRGAFLATHYFTDKTILTPAERRELAASLSFPHSEKGADECERWLGQVTKGIDSSPAKLQRGIGELVRGITSMSLAFPVSLGHLSYLLDLHPESIRKALLDPVSGLQPHELKGWERHSGISTALLKDPLMVRVAEAARRVLSLDTFLYSVGIREQVISEQKLLELFPSLDNSPLSLCAPRGEDKHLRDYLLKEKQDGGMHEVRHSLIYSTLHEIELHKGGQIGKLRSDEELARLEGISSVTVERLLEEGLSESAYRYRQGVLSKGCLLPQCETIAGYRRAELAALQKGEITSLRPEQEISQRFGVSLEEAKEVTTQALSREELLLLDLALKLGERSTYSEYAATLLLQHKLFEQLTTHHIAALKKEMGESAQAKVAFRGCDFDSFEEAALGILLTIYLKGYELQAGNTFQVPNQGKFHDFVIDGAFGGELHRTVLEYHRPRPYYSPSKGGDFSTYEEYQEYRRYREGLSEQEREHFDNQILAYLGNDYHEKRRALLDSHPRFEDFELITVIDPAETYHELKRLNVSLPEKAVFLAQFHTIVKRLKAAAK